MHWLDQQSKINIKDITMLYKKFMMSINQQMSFQFNQIHEITQERKKQKKF